MSIPGTSSPVDSAIHEENCRLRERIAELEREVSEITERKRMEEALRESEAALLKSNETAMRRLGEIEALYGTVPAALALVDADLRFLRVNVQMSEIDGVPVADYLGRTVPEVIPQLWLQLEPVYRKVIDQRQPVHDMEIHGDTKAQPGVERSWLASYDPVSDAGGRFIGVSVLVREITESKRAQEVLKESAQRAQRQLAEIDAIYASAPIGLCVFDDQLRWTRVNHRLAEINGVPAEAHIGKTPREIVPDFAEQAEAALRKVMETGEPLINFEMSGRVPGDIPGDSEQVRYWNHRWVPLKDEQGRVVGVSVAIEETTERRKVEEELRQSERLYRAIGESIDYGVWVSGPDGRNTYASESFLKLVGLTQEQCSSFGWADVLHPDDAERTIAAWKECVRTQGTWEMEHRYRGVDGMWHPILARGVPVRNEQGQIICWAGINVDISALKRTEESLRDSEARERARAAELEAIMDAVPVATFITRDVECRQMTGSRMTYELLRLSPGSNISRFATEKERQSTFRLMKHGVEIPACELPVQTAVFSGEPVRNYELELVFDDGTSRTVLGDAVPLLDESNRVRGAVGGFVDITHRKQFEQALRESEDKFRTLSDSIPQLAWMTDQTGWIFWYNQRWYEYTGTTLEEMEGWGWQKVHHPDHVERVVAHFKTCIQQGTVWEDTFPLRGKDGEYRWFLSRAVPMRDSAGRITRWFGTNTDITERLAAEDRLRVSEERFRRLYEANIIGIVSADAERILEANDVFLQMLGYTREDLEAGRLLWKAFTPSEYLHRDERGLEESLATGSCKPYEKEYFRKDGSRVAILIGATLLESSPVKFLCYILDLTERKELERRLFEKQKLESTGLLAGGIAHDFNNLLVGVIGNASIAQDMLPEGHPAAGLMQEVVKAGEQAAHLTRQMLAYSGKGRLFIEALNLSTVITEMESLVRPSIPKKILLGLNLAPDLPPIEADGGQMQQVFMNLVLNAAEAIGSAAGEITVRTGVQLVDERFAREGFDGADLRQGTYVSLEVRDNGCGMDAATKARIFDPFFSTKFTGRGLGLAAVGGAIRAHKGAVRVETAPGLGSCFTILFPATESAVPARGLPGKTLKPRGSGTVLVVDDEEMVRETAKKALERRGFKVLLADSGPGAIDCYKRHPGDLVMAILDLSMPGMSGQETLPELRKIRPGVPIIVSSGYSEAEAMRVFHGQRVSGFLQKPYTSRRLAELVAATLK